MVILWLCTLAACFSAEITHCPEVDCPKDMVCDNHGGCALPEQLSQCTGKADGTACSYRDRTNAMISGACAGGLCVPVSCGNGIVSPNELCDDGNNNSGDGCAADCRSLETCGNAITDSATGEQCDDGNTTDGDGCQHDCKLPRCGDGVKDTGLDEECDAGAQNTNTPDATCRPNCQLPRCGDGVTDPGAGEVCDDGNNASSDGCSGDCKSNETCGNSIVDALAGEVCDDGNALGGDGCSADCRSIEVCGNGVTDTMLGEVCDDGNTVSGDGCSSDCRSLEVCGNGIIDTINEQCDLGALNSNSPDSGCRTNCKLPVCGDTIRDPMRGEQCDDVRVERQRRRRVPHELPAAALRRPHPG
jgi:cysteine-rich repeat protein